MKSISHLQAQAFLRADVDGRLELYDRVALDAHLALCPTCQRYAATLTTLNQQFVASADQQRATRLILPAPALHELEARSERRRSGWTRALAFGLVVLITALGAGMIWLTATNAPASAPAQSLTSNLTPDTLTVTTTPTATIILTDSVPLVRYSPVDGATLVFIAGGEFVRGTTTQDIATVRSQCEACIPVSYWIETPARTVQVADFWLDQHEVTNGQYATCVAASRCEPPLVVSQPYQYPEYAGYPVAGVTWQQAANYCQQTGRRLPTEAEWERAARGPQNTIYPWGNDPPNDWQPMNLARLSPVSATRFDVSAFGAQDMAGNLAEWTQDWYHPDSYLNFPTLNPQGGTEGEFKMRRGGSWKSDLTTMRAANRSFVGPDVAADDLGFRCAVSAEQADTLDAERPLAPAANGLGGGNGRLAFPIFNSNTGTGENTAYGIHLMNADGRDQHPVMATVQEWFSFSAAWSPDGQRLAFIRTYSETFQFNVLDMHDPTHPLTLTSLELGTTPFIGLQWSPDGKRLLTTRYSENHTEVMVITADGADLYPLLPANMNQIASFGARWSPDGQLIALNRWDAGARQMELLVLTQDASAFTLMAPDLNLSYDENMSFYNSAYFAWWPDSTALVYLSRNAEDSTMLRLMRGAVDLSTNEVLAEVPLPHNPIDLIVTHDGSAALITHNTDTYPAVLTINLITWETYPLYTQNDIPTFVAFPALSPDGQWVVFVGGTITSTDPSGRLTTDLYLTSTRDLLSEHGSAAAVRLTNSSTVVLFPIWQP